MNFSEYQKKAHETAIYPTDIGLFDVTGYDMGSYPLIELKWIYPALGLAGESGELLNKLKKVIRDQNGEIYPSNIIDLMNEIGDLLWYISEICSVFDFDLDMIARHNILKLAKRAKDNKIKGSGDNR